MLIVTCLRVLYTGHRRCSEHAAFVVMKELAPRVTREREGLRDREKGYKIAIRVAR
jgi:hypothetical protein